MNADTLTDNFPYPIIPKIKGKPNRRDIEKLQKKIYANAATMQTNLGGGNHGHLGLTMSDEQCSTATAGQVFNRPANPGLAPIIPQGSTQAQILSLQNTHATNLKQCNTCNLVERTLKNIIINAIEDTRIDSLEDECIGYNNVTILELFDHLHANYGTITNKDLARNEDTLKEEWDTNLPIETLFKRIEKAAAYAAKAGDNMNDRRKIAYAYNLIKATGEFDIACRHWRNKPLAARTWDNFKNDFTREHLAHAEDRDEQTTGQYQANQIHSDEAKEVMKETRDATLADSDMIHQMNNAVMTKLDSISKKLDSLGPNNKENTEPKKRVKHENFFKHCWSCGRTGDKQHASATCAKAKPGHVKNATICNRQGGSGYKCNL